MNTLFVLMLGFKLLACSSDDANKTDQGIDKNEGKAGFADVVSVSVSGPANSYSFSVGISSPDTGCDQYADWWEIVSEDGRLLYRRILLHSHVSEQPFVRSGGPVFIAENQMVWVRSHMNTTGYGGKAYFGSVADGFGEMTMKEGFAADLKDVAPLPDDCDF